MTGAGSGELLFAHEDSFKGSLTDSDSSGTAETYSPGRNETITELDLQRQLQRMREANAVEAAESIAQNFEGAVRVEATVSSDTFAQIEQFVFNDGGSGFVTGRPNTTAWFVGVNYLDGTVDRKLIGCIPLEFQIVYEQGGMVRFSLSMAYANEEKDVTVPTSEATRISDGTSAPFHDFDLSIDGASVTKLQSATLGIASISRFQRGVDPHPVDAVVATPTTTLDVEGIIDGASKIELAYGSASATSTVSASMASVAATVTISVGGTTLSTYSLSQVKPDTYSWSDVINSEADTTESYQLHVNGGVGVS